MEPSSGFYWDPVLVLDFKGEAWGCLKAVLQACIHPSSWLGGT